MANKYTFLWSNAHQLFYMRGNIDSYVRYQDIPFNNAEHVFQVSHGNLMACYVGTEDLKNDLETGKNFLDKSFAVNYLAAAKVQCDSHQKFYRALKATNLTTQTNEQLLSWWRGLMDHYAHSVAYFRSTQEEPSRALIDAVANQVSTENLNSLLLSPELDEINKEGIAWQELLESGYTKERALAHINQFPWLFQNVLDISETIKELEQRSSNPSLHDIAKQKRELAVAQKEILVRHPEIVDHVDTLHQLALLRPEVKAAWASTGFYANNLLEEIATRFKIDRKTLTFLYRHEDVEKLLESGVILSKKDIEDREQCTAYIIRDGKLYDYVGSQALELEKSELELADSSAPDKIQEIRGTVARPGKIQGKVHILLVNDPVSAAEFRKSFTGGVLVTTMTQPNIVDIAQKASAIITDEGGMLSHAAIISREFGIPCIVGTHKATQILKDGDLVEVDADQGIVRILEK